MKKLKAYWWGGIAFLLVLNVILLGFFWWNKPQHKAPAFLEEKLDFSAEQKRQFEQLKEKHKSQMDQLKVGIEQKKESLLGNSSLTDVEAKAIAEELGRLKGQGDYITYLHFKEVRALCTAKQKEKLDDLLMDILKGMPGGLPPERRGMPPPGSMGPPNGMQGPPMGDRPPPPGGF